MRSVISILLFALVGAALLASLFRVFGGVSGVELLVAFAISLIAAIAWQRFSR